MNHEVTVYKHDIMTDTYRRYRAEWVSDKDIAALQKFVSLNAEVKEFYQYRFGNTTFHCMHCDLVEWVRYLANRQLLEARAIKQDDINIIEQ